MDIKFDTADFQSVLTGAIVTALDAQKKDILIKGAVASLFEKEKTGGWSDGKTKLVYLFEQAFHQVATEYIKEYLTTDPKIKETVLGLIHDAVVKLSTDGRNNTVDKISKNIIEGLFPRENY